MQTNKRQRILVLGSGNFGTCLANYLTSIGHNVKIWARSDETVRSINDKHVNPKYLSRFTLEKNLIAAADFSDREWQDADIILIAVPTQSLRDVLGKFKDKITAKHILVSASKGIELKNHIFPIDIISNVLGEHYRARTVVLSGPSFAVEIMEQQPTAVSVACEDKELVTQVQNLFHSPIFRAYGVFDPTGLEVAGALKNVIAIASGACGGLGFKMNSRAALITRGLSEITRFGIKLGANPLTFKGLGGVGDLILTCSSEESRNYRVGYLLGQGKGLSSILSTLGSTAEGVYTAKAAFDLAEKLQVSAPITSEVYAVLYEQKPIAEAVRDLITRSSKEEFDY